MTLKRSVTILKHLNLALNNFRFVVRQIFFMAIFHVKVQRCVYVIFGYYYCQSDMQYKKQVCLSEDGFFFEFVFILCGISSPQHCFFSGWLNCSLDVLQQLHVVCFMLFTFLHIMTGSSGFPQNRYVIFSGLLTLHLPY